MKESNAMKKICPYLSNNYDRGGRFFLNHTKCVTDQCMMWNKTDDEIEGEETGYCSMNIQKKFVE